MVTSVIITSIITMMSAKLIFPPTSGIHCNLSTAAARWTGNHTIMMALPCNFYLCQLAL